MADDSKCITPACNEKACLGGLGLLDAGNQEISGDQSGADALAKKFGVIRRFDMGIPGASVQDI